MATNDPNGTNYMSDKGPRKKSQHMAKGVRRSLLSVPSPTLLKPNVDGACPRREVA